MTQEQGEHGNCKTFSPCQSLEPSSVTFGNGKPQIELPSPRAEASGGTLNSLQTRSELPILPNLFLFQTSTRSPLELVFLEVLFPPGPLFQTEIEQNRLRMI